MHTYIDSSALLAVLLGEDKRQSCLSRVTHGISSEIIRLECLRTFDRLRFLNHIAPPELEALHNSLHEALRSLELIKITPLVLGMAGQSFPTPVKTLDSIHLASALLCSQSRPGQLSFLTFDSQLSKAASAIGLTVH